MVYLGGSKDNKPIKELNKNKIIKISIAIFLVTLFICFAFLYEKNKAFKNFFDVYIFRKVVNEEKVPFIEIDSTKNINIFAYDRFITVLDQNVLKLYNKSGNEEHSLDIEISNPLFEAKGNYLCIAEKGGQKLYLISNKNIVWQKEIEGNISAINVNKNGYISVIISGTSYKTVIQTFDSKGDELFKTYLSSTNVIDTDISNDNKYLAIAEANFSGIVVQSSIKMISIEDAKNNSADSIKYTHLAKANDLIINIKYNTKNDLVCMYDEHIDLLKGEENTQLINLTDEKVIFADINLSSKVTEILNNSDGILNTSAQIKLINSNNTEDINTYEIENIPKNMYVQDNMIAVNLGTCVLFINDKGWLVKKYESNREEIQNVVMCNEIAGIICKNKINIISL